MAWALSLVHSRSFVQAGRHVWVPGIDMANHTLEPNATIRCLQSPGASQGAAALEEVCPPAAAAAAAQEPSRFELVAGEEGIAAGDEVTISYGSWPSDVFLLFFGFAPGGNPHDSGERGLMGGFLLEQPLCVPGPALRGVCRCRMTHPPDACQCRPAAPALRPTLLLRPLLPAPPAAVLFYDLFDLKTFQLRLAAPPDAPADAELDWAAVEAAVVELEAQIGPGEQFVR